jgi:hypothetical protein
MSPHVLIPFTFVLFLIMPFQQRGVIIISLWCCFPFPHA